jgi:hypothetical protein
MLKAFILGFVVLNLQKSIDFSLPGVQNALSFVRSFKKAYD